MWDFFKPTRKLSEAALKSDHKRGQGRSAGKAHLSISQEHPRKPQLPGMHPRRPSCMPNASEKESLRMASVRPTRTILLTDSERSALQDAY